MPEEASIEKGAFRIKDWWRSKTAFLMGMVYLFTLWFDIPFRQFIPLALLSLCTISGFASMGYLLNDFFDRRQDILSAKRNFLVGKPPILIAALLLLSAVFIFLPWTFLPADTFSYLLIALELSLFFVYSAPPIRVKERDMAGIMVDALYAHAVPALLAAYTFSLAAGISFPGYEFLLLFAWQVTAGVRNILLHQHADLSADRKSGTKNFIATISDAGFIFSMKYLIILEILFSLVFFTFLSVDNILFMPCIFVVIAFSVLALCLFYKKGMHQMLVSKWKYFPNNIYEKWLPPLILFLLCLYNKFFVVILLLHLILFDWHSSYQFIKKMYFMAERLYNYLWKDFIYAVLSAFVNYTIYYSLLLFSINLRKEKTSALSYFKKKWCKN